MERITRSMVEAAYAAFIRSMKHHGADVSDYTLRKYFNGWGVVQDSPGQGWYMPLGERLRSNREMVQELNTVCAALWQLEKSTQD